MELRRMNVQTADKGEEPLKPPSALPAQTHSRRWGAGPRSPSSCLRQRRVRSLRTRSLLTPSCYLSGEGSIRTPKASAFPTPLRCCSLLQSSFTNTISQKGLDLCPLSFRIITWQLEKAALPSDIGLSLPLPSGANWHLLSVAHSGHCRSLRAVDPQFQRLGDTGRRTDARIPEAWAQRLRT